VPEQSEGKNSPGGLFLGRGLANPLIATRSSNLLESSKFFFYISYFGGFEKDVPEQSEGKNSPGGLFLGRGSANPLIATK